MQKLFETNRQISVIYRYVCLLKLINNKLLVEQQYKNKKIKKNDILKYEHAHKCLLIVIKSSNVSLNVQLKIIN